MIEIYLIRHGEAIGQGSYLGRRSNPSLSENGRAQVLALKSVLPVPTGACRIYSSPLKRAVETADILFNSSENQTGLCVVDDFCEMDFGEWDGLSWQEISARTDSVYSAWLKDPVGICPPGGEGLKVFNTRVAGGFNSLTDSCVKCGIEKVFITAHGGVIRSILCSLLGLPAENHWFFKIDPASASSVAFFSVPGAPQSFRIDSLNVKAY